MIRRRHYYTYRQLVTSRFRTTCDFQSILCRTYFKKCVFLCFFLAGLKANVFLLSNITQNCKNMNKYTILYHSVHIVHYCTNLYNSVQTCTIVYKLVQQCTIVYNIIHYCIILYNIVQYCTLLYNIVQVRASLYKFVQHCTIVYNIVQQCTLM